jgi:RimJ/RimL family protein N-acetyltransferase
MHFLNLAIDYIKLDQEMWLRPARDIDGLVISKWRNSKAGRDAFFSTGVVTPDHHVQFLKNKHPLDMVFMIELPGKFQPIGMNALVVAPATRIAEYGRVFMDPEYRGQGLSRKAEYLLLAAAFELFELDLLWGDAYVSNKAVLNLHQSVGFELTAVDLPNHRDSRGPVQHITYHRQTWASHREVAAAKYGWPLDEWQA